MADSRTGKLTAAEVRERLAALEESVRRAPRRRDDEEEPEATDRHSLQARVRETTRQRNEAERRLQEALQVAKDLATTHESELKTIREDAARSVTEGVRRVDEKHTLKAMMHEADDDGIATAIRTYEAIPENKRPASIIDWWKGLDEKSAPKPLRGYLKPAAEDDEPEEPAEKAVSTGAKGGERSAQMADPPRAQKKAPPIDQGRGRGKEKSFAEMSDDEYDKALMADRQKVLTAGSASV